MKLEQRVSLREQSKAFRAADPTKMPTSIVRKTAASGFFSLDAACRLLHLNIGWQLTGEDDPSGEIENPPNGGWRVVPMFQRIPAKGLPSFMHQLLPEFTPIVMVFRRSGTSPRVASHQLTAVQP